MKGVRTRYVHIPDFFFERDDVSLVPRRVRKSFEKYGLLILEECLVDTRSENKQHFLFELR
jgi:DNA replication protein DnaC